MPPRRALLLVAALLASLAFAPARADSVGCGDATGDVGCGTDPADAGSAPPRWTPRTTLGNPIELITGNKYQRESDFEAMGSVLAFQRYYNSANADHDLGLGRGWSSTYSTTLFRIGGDADTPDGLDIVQGNGRRLRFRERTIDPAGRVVFHADATSDGHVRWRAGDGARSTWHLPDGRVLAFQGSWLVRIDWPGRRSLALYYRERLLASVTDETGRVLRLEWTARRGTLGDYGDDGLQSFAGHLAAIVLPDGSRVAYRYDRDRNLASARFPDDTERRYHYEDPLHPHHLTGLTDRTGRRFATWRYAESGRAASSTHAGGVERLELAYELPASDDGRGLGATFVTNSLGEVSTYRWQREAGAGTGRLLSSEGAGCASCPPTGYRYAYTADGQLASSEHTSGRIVRRRYDEHGRLVDVTEQAPTGEERLVVRHEYADAVDPLAFVAPARVARPSVDPDGLHVVEITRDAAGLPDELIERGFTPIVPTGTDARDIDPATLAHAPIERRTRFVHEAGRLVAIDGPRDDVDDITRFAHDERGRLVALALLGQPPVRVTRFDALDRPLEVRVGQRSPYALEYDLGNRLVRLTQLGRTIRFGHDAEGRMRSVTDTEGRTTRLERDAAGRPRTLIDDLGRRTEYTRDTESRLVRVRELGLDGQAIRSTTHTLDAAGRLASLVEEGLAVADEQRRAVFERDADGRLLGANDPAAGGRIAFEHDPFGTPLALIEPSATGEVATRFVLDARGRTIGIVDRRGNTTWRLADDFGRVVVDAGPDTGVVRITHDAAGHPLTRLDAEGRETRYRHDGAGRLVERATPDDTATFLWDDASGLLRVAANDTTRETFEHDTEARLVAHRREIDGRTFLTRYTHDDAGRVATKTLPDGEVLDFHYHADGTARGTLRAITRRTLFGLSQQTLVAEIDLDARDGHAGYVSANGVRTDYRHRADGALETLEIGQGLRLDYRYDAAGRIVGIDRDGLSRRFAWESGRLALAETGTGRHVYEYDAAGNRTARELTRPDGRFERERLDYPAPGNGNRLLARTDEASGDRTDYSWTAGGSVSRERTARMAMPIASAAGRTAGAVETSSHELVFETDADARPVRVHRDGVLIAEYRYNAFGERVKKVVHGTGATPRITYFLYDGATLSAEIDGADGAAIQYVHLDGHRPVARLAGSEVHAIHADPLGTPRLMTDESGATVWAADPEPFGAMTPTIETVALPLRLPGQYHDAETGTHYNYHRDYDPALGRYRSSDPLGTDGGANAYAYADGNPLQLIDPLGLSTDASLTAGAVAKPEADFASKLDHVVELTIVRLEDHGLRDLATSTLNELKDTAIVLGSIAGIAGIGLGAASLATGGAALPVGAGLLASAASAVGVVALWTAGIQGVMLIYDLIRIGLGVHDARHTDCARLDDLSEQLYQRLVRAGGTVLSDVASVGLGKIAGKLQDVFKAPARVAGRCSFAGDTLVPTRAGPLAIRDIDPARDEVWARDERTGDAGWKRVLARYDNRYEATVRVTARGAGGGLQTIVSNLIHPFFTRLAAGAMLVAAAEGHIYAGEIEGGAWVDAQHLETGQKLLGRDGEWQDIVDVAVADEPLRAFNLTVEDYATYFVAGSPTAEPVWVHNTCYDEVPTGWKGENVKRGHNEFGQETLTAGKSEVLYRAYDPQTGTFRYYEQSKHPANPTRFGNGTSQAWLQGHNTQVGVVKKGLINGAHNQRSFLQTANQSGAKIVSGPTPHSTKPGVFIYEYKTLKKDGSGEHRSRTDTKTVYDSDIVSDAKVAELSELAAHRARFPPNERSTSVQIDGFWFAVYKDSTGGIGNVHLIEKP